VPHTYSATNKQLLLFQIKPVNKDTRHRYDWVRDGMPSTVTVDNRHNHMTLNAEALSFRKTDLETRKAFEDYFSQGMTAAAASQFHSNQLDLNPDLDGNVAVAQADAAMNPKRSTVSYWHDLWRKENLGERHGEGMWEMLERKVAVYAEAGARVSVTREPFTVALLTPVMQRAHHMSSAAEVAFVDSTASCDADNHVITFLLVTSSYGAVPAGVVITSGQSQQDYLSGFTAINRLLSDSGFGRQGHPDVFITDDSSAERSALESVWPSAVQKLCHFHVLQAVWRWLWNAAHNIQKEDRQPLMQKFRSILYATTEVEADTLYQQLLELAEDYDNCCAYFQSWWDRREAWCMAWRNIASLRGHNTNNYAEVTIRLFKDNVLSRCKAYNAVAIVDFIMSTMEKFYSNRLQCFANGRVSMHHLLLEKLLASCRYISSKDDILIAESHGAYLVPSEHDNALLYEVDAGSGVCTCPYGMSGRCCKHQIAVFKWYHEALPNVPPVTAEARYTAARLALGDDAPAPQFYASMTSLDAAVPLPQMCVGHVPTSQTQPTTSSVQLDDTDDVSVAAADDCAEMMQQWQAVSARVSTLLQQHNSSCNVADLSAGIRKMSQRLDNVHTAAQLSTFFHSCGQLVPRRYHSGAVIRTQPTASARRKPGITRGAKRQPSGRPAKGEAAAEKRPRCLSTNIDANVPHAKSHGKGH